MKCGWRSQQCITPKKAIHPILGNRKESIQASGLGHTKNMSLKNLPQEGHLSPQRPQPRLSQLPLLPQEHGKVVHGMKRVRMIRTEVRFAPCKSSAVQGLRLASRDGTGGVGPAGLDPPASTMWTGKKGGQRP